MVTIINNGGKSIENAIIIKDATYSEGVGTEYDILEKEYGVRGVGWQLDNQALIEDKGHQFDELDIILKDGTKLSIFFDITEFFDKW
jgi:hypothetical protein